MDFGFFDAVWSNLLEFAWLAALAVPAGLLLGLGGNKLSAALTWRQRRVKVLGVLFYLTLREQLFVAAGFFRVVFVAGILLFGIYLKTPHTLLYILLVLGANGLFFHPKRLVFDFLNSGIVYIALVVSNLLIGFYRDATGDGLMLVIYILTSIFIVQYALYFYLKSLYTLLQEKTVPQMRKSSMERKHLRLEAADPGENYEGDTF